MTKPSGNTVSDKVLALILPVVSDLGLDLYDLEWNGGILKITVDTLPGNEDGGITLDQLALVTRLIGREFDHHDPIASHYTLEVSSPGLERNLRTASHFQREIGKQVNIRLQANIDGMRRIQGMLIAADDTTATVRLDDTALTERVIAIEMIDRAKTVFQWDKGEKVSQKPGSPAKKKAAPKQAAETKKNAPKNSPKRTTTVKSGLSSGAMPGGKPAPGPSDELDTDLSIEDRSIEEEATA